MITDTLFTFTTEPKTPDDVAKMIATRPFLVLPDKGGFATYSPFRSGPGYAATMEHSILLDPSAQGRGDGRRLMQALLDHGRSEGHHAMIGAVSSANPNAIAFHAAMGFDTVAQMPEVGRKGGQWLDLILMQKLL